MIESEKYQILENYFYRIILIIFAVFILITLIYSFEGNKIIDLVYRRGKFTSKESEMVYAALKMYSVSLLFYAVFSVIYKMMFSLGLSRLLLIYTFGVFAVKILLNILLVKELDYTGLALSSSISYIIITICCYLTVIRKLKLQMKNVYVE